MYRGVGTNNTDGHHIVAYEILTVVSLCCTEWHSSPKKACSTLGDAYPRVNLRDVKGLEHLALAINDGVYMPCNPPVPTGHLDLEHIIVGTILLLIFHGTSSNKHSGPLMVASHNAK